VRPVRPSAWLFNSISVAVVLERMLPEPLDDVEARAEEEREEIRRQFES